MGRPSKQEAEKTFREIIEEKQGFVLGTYVNTNTKVLLQCKNNHQWEATPAKIKSGRWCPKCRGCCPIQAEEDFRNLVSLRGGIILGTYIDTQHPIEIKCSQGHLFKVRPYSVKSRGDWCSRCARCSPEQALSELEEIVSQRKGKILEDYQGAHTKILFECEKGHQWKATPGKVKTAGRWCPYCNESHLEREARLFLEENGIVYKREYCIEQLPNKRYDFFFRYEDKSYLLELDGRQHFNFNPHFYTTQEEFILRQNLDRLKTLTALEAGYHLIRIDDTQGNRIKDHLSRALLSDSPMYLSSQERYAYLDMDISTEFILSHSPFLAWKRGLVKRRIKISHKL